MQACALNYFKARQTEFTIYRHCPHEILEFLKNFQVSESPPQTPPPYIGKSKVQMSLMFFDLVAV